MLAEQADAVERRQDGWVRQLPASPRKTTSARDNLIMSSALRPPMCSPSLERGTVVILSTISRLDSRIQGIVRYMEPGRPCPRSSLIKSSRASTSVGDVRFARSSMRATSSLIEFDTTRLSVRPKHAVQESLPLPVEMSSRLPPLGQAVCEASHPSDEVRVLWAEGLRCCAQDRPDEPVVVIGVATPQLREEIRRDVVETLACGEACARCLCDRDVDLRGVVDGAFEGGPFQHGFHGSDEPDEFVFRKLYGRCRNKGCLDRGGYSGGGDRSEGLSRHRWG